MYVHIVLFLSIIFNQQFKPTRYMTVNSFLSLYKYKTKTTFCAILNHRTSFYLCSLGCSIAELIFLLSRLNLEISHLISSKLSPKLSTNLLNEPFQPWGLSKQSHPPVYAFILSINSSTHLFTLFYLLISLSIHPFMLSLYQIVIFT